MVRAEQNRIPCSSGRFTQKVGSRWFAYIQPPMPGAFLPSRPSCADRGRFAILRISGRYCPDGAKPEKLHSTFQSAYRSLLPRIVRTSTGIPALFGFTADKPLFLKEAGMCPIYWKILLCISLYKIMRLIIIVINP